jgi:Fe-S oxidoreductase
MDKWARLASIIPGVTPRLANLPLELPGVSSVVKSVLGVAPQRTLPRFAPYSFTSRYRKSPAASENRVLLWPDTWNNYYHPQTLAAAQQVLESAGCGVDVPRQHLCCGRPLYDFGFLTAARQYLQRAMQALGHEIDSGTPIVFLEPSCASVFRDELRNFFPKDARAAALRNQTYILSDYLVRHAPQYQPPSLDGQRIVLHGHCHHKSLMKMDSEVALLRRTGADVTLLDSGCCGMAGPFGFEREKFEVSQSLAERVLLPAVRSAAPQDLVVTDGFSCREQIAQNSPRRALHLAEVLARPGSLKQE